MDEKELERIRRGIVKYLSRADLSGANLSRADLSGADLSRADLSGANLSGATGVPTSPDLCLEVAEGGFIAYKSFGENYTPPEHWKIDVGSILKEKGVNWDRFTDCGSGINVGTLRWCKEHCRNDIYKVLIAWEDVPNMVVPFNSVGKFRVNRIKILEKVS